MGRKKMPDPEPVEALLAKELPESADSYVGQARAAADRVSAMDEEIGKIEQQITDCKEEILKVKQDYDLTGLQKKLKKLRIDSARLTRETVMRSAQMTLPFFKAG